MRFKAEPGVRLLSADDHGKVAVETMWSIPVIAWEVAIYHNRRLAADRQILGTRAVLPVVSTDNGPQVVDKPCPLMFEDGSIRAYHGVLQPDNTVKLKTVMFPSLLAFVRAARGNTWEI